MGTQYLHFLGTKNHVDIRTGSITHLNRTTMIGATDLNRTKRRKIVHILK